MCGLSFTMTYVFLLFFAFYYLWRPKDFLKKYENLSSDLKNNKIGINRFKKNKKIYFIKARLLFLSYNGSRWLKENSSLFRIILWYPSLFLPSRRNTSEVLVTYGTITNPIKFSSIIFWIAFVFYIFMPILFLVELPFRFLFMICTLGFYSPEKFCTEVLKTDPPICYRKTPLMAHAKRDPYSFILGLLWPIIVKLFNADKRISFVGHLVKLHRLKLFANNISDKSKNIVLNDKDFKILKTLFLSRGFVSINNFTMMKSTDKLLVRRHEWDKIEKDKIQEKAKERNPYIEEKKEPLLIRMIEFIVINRTKTALNMVAGAPPDSTEELEKMVLLNNSLKYLAQNNVLNDKEYKDLVEWIVESQDRRMDCPSLGETWKAFEKRKEKVKQELRGKLYISSVKGKQIPFNEDFIQ